MAERLDRSLSVLLLAEESGSTERGRCYPGKKAAAAIQKLRLKELVDLDFIDQFY